MLALDRRYNRRFSPTLSSPEILLQHSGIRMTTGESAQPEPMRLPDWSGSIAGRVAALEILDNQIPQMGDLGTEGRGERTDFDFQLRIRQPNRRARISPVDSRHIFAGGRGGQSRRCWG